MEIPGYRILLDIDEKTLEFGGEVELDVRECPPTLTLNARDLAISSVTVDGRAASYRSSPEREELHVAGVAPGEHRVVLAFSGKGAEKGLMGLYRSPFGAKSLLTTMLYPNGARRLFPCVDEPSCKSVFDVSVVVDADSEVIFNTPVREEERVGSRRRVRFAPTPRMSTYLIYLAVGRFGTLERRGGTARVIVAAPPGREAAGAFALDHALQVLAGFDRYFGIPYPLEKLHLVSVPDFWAGAMENWGAIAFHETRLLLDANTTARVRRRIRETVTHEIAHQWFGNLVTMAWWNDFWLNESFATFMQAKLDGKLYPELDTWSDFLLTFPRWGYGGDSLASTHPIRVEVSGADALGEIADEISYGKGAAVLAMIEAYLGEEPFRRGVERYLRAFSYQNARAQDLWEALEVGSAQPVSRIMGEWVAAPGHPVVTVRREGNRLRLDQERFCLSGETPSHTWPIPLTYRIGETFHRELFDEPSMSLPAPSGAPFLINPDRTGFYRVRYSPELLGEIRARFEELSEVDRWGLIVDAEAFLLAGQIPAEEFVRLLEVAGVHPSPLTTGEVVGNYLEFDPVACRIGHLDSAWRRYFSRALDRIGLEPTPGEAEALGGMRNLLTMARVRSEPSFARAMAQRFDRLDSVPPDLRPAVIVAYARSEGDGAVEVLRERMFAAESEEVARQMAVGLASPSSAEALAKALPLALDARMPASRAWAMLGSANLTRVGGAVLWEWWKTHLGEVERLLEGTPLLSKLLEALIPLVGVDRPAEVGGRFRAQRVAGCERGVAKGLELLEVYGRFLISARR